MAYKPSLKKQGHDLSDSMVQLKVLNSKKEADFERFDGKLKELDLFPLKPTQLEVFQINVGKMCNQVCGHCHVDAGPDRKEIMTRETMQQCLDAIEVGNFTTVDLTGGAPEMNPDFRWFVEGIRKIDSKINIIVRSNLTIIRANKKYYDLPEFFKANNIEVTSSLPHYSAKRTDAQRGDGVYEASIKALNMLNDVGYGIEGSGLTLNLVYNPSGAYLPGDQTNLENQFKRELKRRHNIVFNSLFAITNLPVSRFLDYLVESGNYETYMESLIAAFNPVAAANVMCRNTVSISWDGFLYDCDFNQMLELNITKDKSDMHIKDFDESHLLAREIILNQHCYGCTAGAGSSCGGEVA